jgi:alkylated DNA nucleotide flippase Atl1
VPAGAPALVLAYNVFVSLEQVRQISAAIPEGWWTTYQDIGELVYGHRRAMQPVGDLLGRAGDVDGAHRILLQGGHISRGWRRTDGGPEKCLCLLREECAWDDARDRARQDRYLDAPALRRSL